MSAAADEVALSWPGVKAKNVFGHRGYVRSGTMFGFVAEGGVAVKALTDVQSAALLARDGAEFFTYNGMPMKAWVVLPIRTEDELQSVLTALYRSYEGVG
jgi:TfoX/Sxy family transcriptional regulator of competence genes